MHAMYKRRTLRLNDLMHRRETEKEFNEFPQFTYEIEGLRIHFVALFSEKQDAKPIAFLHGWPGR